MTKQAFPITPPPGWVFELLNEACKRAETLEFGKVDYVYMVNKTAQWGADQELEACCEWLRSKDILEPAIDALRAARRPKPPSLKEQALRELGDIYNDEKIDGHAYNTIRRALEQLND